MKLKDLEFVLESLQELIPDPEIDFGPAYEFAKARRVEAIKIIRAEINWLKRSKK
jgi:hypothetical protein